MFVLGGDKSTVSSKLPTDGDAADTLSIRTEDDRAAIVYSSPFPLPGKPYFLSGGPISVNFSTLPYVTIVGDSYSSIRLTCR